MDYSSRRPHRVPLQSSKNRKRRLQFVQAHQNWTIEDWKNVAWSDESRFLLRHSDAGVRIWRKEHESMDPSCLVSNGAFPLHGTARYGSVRFTFGRFSNGYCTWYLVLFSTTPAEVPRYPYRYQNITCKLY